MLANRLIASAWMVAALSWPAAGQDWPHWRGPGRNDHVAEDSRFDAGAWPPKAPAWRVEVGQGSTSPIVVAGRLYTLGWSNNQDHLVCLDAASGATLWRQSYPSSPYGRHSMGDKGLYGGPTATPEFDADTAYLYTLSNDGDLQCWDTKAQGRRVWRLNLYDTYHVSQRPQVTDQGHRDYGYTTSPLVWGDWLIVEVGDDEGNLMAFDKRTGRRAWTSQNKDPAGHTGGPAPITVEGVPCVAVMTIKNLLVARLDKGHAGQTVAQFPWATDFANSIASAAVHDDSVVITSGYNQDAVCKVKITLRGASELWRTRGLSSKACSPVIQNGCVYFAWHSLYCLDFQTGRVKWKGGGSLGDPGSCIVTGDGRLIVWVKRGDLLLVESADRSPNAYKELAHVDGVFRSDAWPHVVLAGGRLYCKERRGAIVCFDLTAPKPRR